MRSFPKLELLLLHKILDITEEYSKIKFRLADFLNYRDTSLIAYCKIPQASDEARE